MTSYWDDDDYGDYAQDAAREEFVKETLKGISYESAKTYLGTYGDAIDARVKFCLTEAEAFLNSEHFGASLCHSATAIELMIRFLVLRPLIQGAFLSDEWAGILVGRVASGRTAEDRSLLPAVLKAWEIDLVTVQTTSGNSVWETLCKEIWPNRNNFVHRADPISKDLASKALEIAVCFRNQIVAPIASKLEFTLATTGKWCEIKGEKTYDTPQGPRGHSSWYQSFDPKDPFSPTGQNS